VDLSFYNISLKLLLKGGKSNEGIKEVEQQVNFKKGDHCQFNEW